MLAPVAVSFLDFAFNNENIDMYCFHEWDAFLITFSYDTKKLKSKSLLSLEKKETFACLIFGKICYVACAINCAG